MFFVFLNFFFGFLLQVHLKANICYIFIILYGPIKILEYLRSKVNPLNPKTSKIFHLCFTFSAFWIVYAFMNFKHTFPTTLREIPRRLAYLITSLSSTSYFFVYVCPHSKPSAGVGESRIGKNPNFQSDNEIVQQYINIHISMYINGNLLKMYMDLAYINMCVLVPTYAYRTHKTYQLSIIKEPS